MDITTFTVGDWIGLVFFLGAAGFVGAVEGLKLRDEAQRKHEDQQQPLLGVVLPRDESQN